MLTSKPSHTPCCTQNIPPGAGAHSQSTHTELQPAQSTVKRSGAAAACLFCLAAAAHSPPNKVGLWYHAWRQHLDKRLRRVPCLQRGTGNAEAAALAGRRMGRSTWGGSPFTAVPKAPKARFKGPTSPAPAPPRRPPCRIALSSSD